MRAASVPAAGRTAGAALAEALDGLGALDGPAGALRGPAAAAAAAAAGPGGGSLRFRGLLAFFESAGCGAGIAPAPVAERSTGFSLERGLSPSALSSWTGSLPAATSSSTLRCSVLFQWFLMALSVRPTNSFAMSAHLLPYLRCASSSLASSTPLHPSRLMSGLRWLCHRSRHCLPMRPGSCWAIFDHCFGPSSFTSWMIFSSSSAVHGPLTRSGFSTFCQRCRHCTSVRSWKNSAIFFQFLPLYRATALRSTSSSSGVQPPFELRRVGPPVFPSTVGSSASFTA
mmetsp:Transcript_23675/g.80704  ORF Transcript_23675/g.80704 Transcript_23675/m.80704 type:complete len:285 (-) Transcript_23675:136-990(-)